MKKGSSQAAQELSQRLFDADLQFAWDLHCYLYNSPFRQFLSKVVSAHPLNDISLATWTVFLAYLYDYGECLTSVKNKVILKSFIPWESASCWRMAV